jgi:hypothetical protein
VSALPARNLSLVGFGVDHGLAAHQREGTRYVENGVRRASPGTYAMLENKLAWAPGSIDTVLAGGEPKQLVVRLRRDSPEPRYEGFTTDALSRASTEELLLELRRRIIRPHDRRREDGAAAAGELGGDLVDGETGGARWVDQVVTDRRWRGSDQPAWALCDTASRK